MAGEGLEALSAQLGTDLPAGVRELGDEQLADLAAVIREARRRETVALAQAGEQALRHIPRVLRGPVRRVAG